MTKSDEYHTEVSTNTPPPCRAQPRFVFVFCGWSVSSATPLRRAHPVFPCAWALSSLCQERIAAHKRRVEELKRARHAFHLQQVCPAFACMERESVCVCKRSWVKAMKAVHRPPITHTQTHTETETETDRDRQTDTHTHIDTQTHTVSLCSHVWRKEGMRTDPH